MEILPELAKQNSGGIQGYTANIPRVDLMLEDNKIGKNPPASGIRIFEEHQKTRQSKKSLSPHSNRSQGMHDSPSHKSPVSNGSGLDRQSAGSSGHLGASAEQKKSLTHKNSNNRLSFLDAQLNYQVAPQ